MGTRFPARLGSRAIGDPGKAESLLPVLTKWTEKDEGKHTMYSSPQVWAPTRLPRERRIQLNETGVRARLLLDLAVLIDANADQQQRTDNLIEREFVPILMKYAWDGRLPHSALNTIGGQKYFAALLARDWQRPPGCVHPGGDTDDGDRVFGRTAINRDLFALIQIDSPVAHDFRLREQNRLFELVTSSLVEPRDTSRLFLRRHDLPHHLNFLFLRSGNQPSLALSYWPTFRKFVSQCDEIDNLRKLKWQWQYLSKMWPDSTPNMFAAVHPDVYINDSGFSYDRLLSDRIPPSDRFEILESIKQKLRPDGDPHGGIAWQQKNLACDAGDAIYISVFKRRAGKPGTLEQLQFMIGREFARTGLIRMLAECEHHEARRLAVKGILHIPAADRLPMLEALTTDKNPVVAKEANEAKGLLQQLLNEPLPFR